MQFNLSATFWFKRHQQQCDAIADYFSGIYCSDELDKKLAVADSKYAKNWLTDAQYDAIVAEYDKLDEIVIAGSIGEIDDEGEIWTIDGEEIIDED